MNECKLIFIIISNGVVNKTLLLKLLADLAAVANKSFREKPVSFGL